MGKGSIHIGTSGWHYQHWKGPFYPPRLPGSQLLSFYAQRFQTVEVNNTFYRLPAGGTVSGWGSSVPAGFVFAVKASRYITHIKRLLDAQESLSTFLGRIEALEEKLGPVLFQLPARWGYDHERLRRFLEALPAHYRYAFELRDPAWLQGQAREALAERGAAFCMYDFAGRQSPRWVTADFVYVRLHGPDGTYQGRYDDRALQDWAAVLSAAAAEGKDAYCYFDNDENAYAAMDALRLKEICGQGLPPTAT